MQFASAGPDRCKCFAYAQTEMRRLLGRIGIEAGVSATIVSAAYCLQLRRDSAGLSVPPSLEGLQSDGYVIRITAEEIVLAAPTAKGVLNAVYDLAQRLGYVFLLPGATGERAPARREFHLPEGEMRANPRFKHRGIFWQPLEIKDYTVEEWLRFHAKLRFNAVSHQASSLALCEELGLRLEVGDHGLSHLLPREQFTEHPEYFRMFQPEDFRGKRQSDSNLCITNPQARRIVQENYHKKLANLEGVYAEHAWADDLPAGGWCLCAACRAFSPADQAMLATRVLAEVVAQHQLPHRVPMLAYHDTMYPGRQIAPPREAFLLFAPRERCYGHALDDASCPRNRFYLQALREWTQCFAGSDDAHTFEYYFDQILFRGLHPFLPQIILDDMRVYESHGIQTHLFLQVGGAAVAPEFNALVFAQGCWDRDLTAEAFMAQLAAGLAPDDPAPVRHYLQQRAEIFTDALRMCQHDTGIYLDYRWLPETTHPFGEEIAQVYAQRSGELRQAAEALAPATLNQVPPPEDWRNREANQARFEACELQVMAHQQTGLNRLAQFQNTGDQEKRRQGMAALEQARNAFVEAAAAARTAQIPENCWYFGNINKWLTDEFARKIALYREYEA